MPFTYGEGHVKNVLIDNDTNILTLVYAAASLPGSSGSGVFDEKGRLIGIHTMGYKSVSYATDITIVEGFLGLRGSRRY
jgi:V8-like Glu-specific endopeptidase